MAKARLADLVARIFTEAIPARIVGAAGRDLFGLQLLQPVDPLFLTKGARYYLDEAKGGAKMQRDWNIPILFRSTKWAKPMAGSSSA